MSECTVKDQLSSEMKKAMRNRDKARLATIRLALAELQRIEIDEKSLNDTRALACLDKMAKQRRDAIVQFESAGRTDLADQEKFELTVLKDFLPEPLSSEAVDQIVRNAITQSGAEGMKDIGKVMGLVKPQVQGRADMAQISQSVKKLLG